MNEAIIHLRGVQLSIVLAIQACSLIYNAVLQLLQPYSKYCTTLHHLQLQHCSASPAVAPLQHALQRYRCASPVVAAWQHTLQHYRFAPREIQQMETHTRNAESGSQTENVCQVNNSPFVRLCITQPGLIKVVNHFIYV